MKIIEDYINSLMELTTPERPIWNIEKIKAGKKSGWDYIDGCMILAFLEMYKIRGEERFLSFAKKYVDHRIADDGTVSGYDKASYNLDNVNGGKNLLTLYELTGEEKYKLAAAKIFEQVKEQPRTAEGNFWHKLIYPDQVWLDGLYMVMPFYVRYANLFMNDEERSAVYSDVYSQFFNVEKHMKDDKTGLYYHAYDSSKKMFWCDRETGLSRNFWLRALGWFSMAMLDSLLELKDKESEEYAHLLNMFNDMIASLLKYQDASGMFWQLPVYGGREKNYLETSGSAIFAYCLKKGAKAGLLPSEMYEKGQRCFEGICKTYLTEEEGRMGLGGICLVAGLGGEKMRDGSYDYYMSEPIVKDDAKGTAPFVLAYLY